jgi:DNA replication protein DnaC
MSAQWPWHGGARRPARRRRRCRWHLGAGGRSHLGYVQLDTRVAELFFQILTEREEKSSVAVASNLPFSEWGQVITDARLVAAIVDRLTFQAHIIETGTESFRLRTTRKGRGT